MVEPLVELKGIQPCIRPNPSETVNTQNSWGRSTVINEGEAEQIVRVQLPDQMGVFLVTVRANRRRQGNDLTVVYPKALIQWGNGNVLNSDIVDCTGGLQQVVVGTTVQVKVFLADADGNPPANGSGASATFFASASWGITPYPERNTTWYRNGDAVKNVLVPLGGGTSPVQGRTFGFRGTANLGTASFIQFFDKSRPLSLATSHSRRRRFRRAWRSGNCRSRTRSRSCSVSHGAFRPHNSCTRRPRAEFNVAVYAEVANNG